jgi:hypothetical protein
MPTVAELTPHLAAAMPRLAALVPWLLVWGVTVIVLALTASVLVARGAARITTGGARADPLAGRASIFGAAERRLRRARRLLLVVLGCLLALWSVLWLAGLADPLLTELTFGVLVAGILGPIAIAMRILEGAMTRAAARTLSPEGERAADGRV